EPRVVVVHVAVAVVVDAVADLDGARVDVRRGVVAVAGHGDVLVGRLAGRCGAGRIAVAVEVAVEPPGGGRGVGVLVVDERVAVVVLAVADLGARRAHRGVAVVAVRRVEDVVGGLGAGAGGGPGVAEAVAVGVGVPGRRVAVGVVVVGQAVAVGVDAVADLGGAGVGGAARVVAVGRVDDVAGR